MERYKDRLIARLGSRLTCVRRISLGTIGAAAARARDNGEHLVGNRSVAARGTHRHRFRTDLPGALRDLSAREGRRRRYQDRAAGRRAVAPARPPGKARDLAVCDAESEQARGDAEPKARAWP